MRCFFIHELRPRLNVQSDSIRAKILISFSLVFFFVSFYCLFTPAKFLYLSRAYIDIYYYVFTMPFTW